MRKQLIETVEKLLLENDKTVLLLGDIGVFGFRNSFKEIPDRTYNIGILEQSTVSLASGLSKVGMIPFVHTIAPFLVERCLEQLKLDFGYQNLNGNFISIGASYDYTALGCTHHCPGDIIALSSIPNMQIITPGTSKEFDSLMKETYNNGLPTYYRLSEYENNQDCDVKFGKALKVKDGKKATIICFGNMLQKVIESTENLDVTILYYTTVSPFDSELLLENFNSNIIVCEPFYEGSVNYFITKTLSNKKYSINNIGIPREFLTKYGNSKEMDEYLGLDVESIKNKITKLCMI
jgi:transketolase